MPRAVNRSTIALETGQAKLWLLLVGVNHYQDEQLPSLQYSAIDCQGLAEALTEASQAFPQKSIQIHHDFAANAPTLSSVRDSLKDTIAAANAQDTVLFYFSGHGVLDPHTHQAVLCLADTQKDSLLDTGLGFGELLELLGQCAAKQQIVWLDACHSGGMTLRGARGSVSLPNPTSQLVGMLGQRAAQSQGFYALLSCDQSQQSWEFPELGHGVFTYFLMKGLRGEAADAQGVIEADGLYKYVYHQTLQYIDKTNQQLRLINQQKRGRGETQLQSEYPLQTPKRIVEGFGELVLGVVPTTTTIEALRQAIVVETLPDHLPTIELSKILRNAGGFELSYYPQPGIEWGSVRHAIATELHKPDAATVLVYLRGKLEETPDGDSWLVLGDGERLPRSWLRQELRRSTVAQQIIVLDCPGATSLADWVEDLQLGSDRGQCLIAAASPWRESHLLIQTVLETLKASDRKTGLPVAGWIAQLQLALAGKMPLQVWLSGAQGVIEVLPGRMTSRTPDAGFDLGLCPYRGLQAFTEDDAQYFYGRETLTQQLLQAIQQQACLAIVGASGSGKSSIVQAGLIAQLRQGKQIPGSETWWIGRMRPGDRPLEALSKCLAAGTREHANQQIVEGLLHQGTEGFVHWLRSRPEPMVLLVVDQFEELFTLSPAEDRQRFLNLVLEAVKYASDRFKLVLTLRADFIASGLEVPDLAPILQRSSLLVPPNLGDEDYRQVIVRPAEQVGLKVEAGLVEVLLQELDRSAGDLPLLEFVLEQLWQQRQSGELTLKAYQQQIGGLRGALERKAQSAYDSLDADAQNCARWIFLSLTQLGDTTEDTRRRILKSDLIVSKYPAELVDRTLQSLTAAKLIVVDNEDSTPPISRGETTPHSSLLTPHSVTIEVAHEILIRHWSTLRWWLDENRSRLRAQRQVEQAAQNWNQSDRQPDFLLRGIRLAEAEELYIKYTDELPQDTQRFIEACLDARLQEQKEAQRRLRRAQQVAATIAVLGFSACGFAGFALWNQRNAQIREIEALSASSEALLASNQQLESLTAALKAGQRLQQLDRPWNFLPDSFKMSTIATLQQAISQTQEIDRLNGHAQQVNAATFSPDGQLIATVSDDRTVKLWNRNGELLKDLTGHQDKVTAVAFSPNSQILATASADKTIKLWNRDGKLLQTLTGHTDWVTDVQFSPTGQLLASTSRDGTLKLWRSGKAIQILRGHKGWINSASFSPDSRQIISGGEDGTVKVWQIGKDAPIKSLTAHKERVTSVAYSPDGKQFVTAGDQVAKLWTLAGKEVATLEGHSDQVNRVSFSPDGKTLATGSIDHTIKLWNLEGALLETIRGHGAAIMTVSFSPDGTELLSASADKTARLWQIANVSKPLNTGLSIASSSPNGKSFAVANADNAIELWQRNGTDLQRSRILKGHTAPIAQLSFSPDGKILATASADKTIRLWNAGSGALLKTLTGHSDRATALGFRRDGKVLASGSADKTIKLWMISNGALMDTLNGHSDEISALQFSADGRSLISGSFDQTIRVWSLERKNSMILGRHKLAISSLAFSSDGKTLASASWDNTIRLWTIDDAKLNQELSPRQTLVGHQSGVTSLSFQDQMLASGSDDGTIKLWDSETGTLLKTLNGTQDRVQSVLFNGNALVSSSDRFGLMLWNFDVKTLMKQACDRIQTYLHTQPDSNTLCPK